MLSQSTSGSDNEVCVVTGYDLNKKVVETHEPTCVAKQAITGTRKRFWIKFCTSGSNAGHMLNPHAPDFSMASLGKRVQAFGKDLYEFRPVKEEAFKLYMKYLETKNPLNIKGAERVV